MKAGLRLVIGSWKIIDMRLPRMRAIARSDSDSRSVPAKLMRFAERCPPRASRLMTASAVTDLPQPDSPTRQWVSPFSTVQRGAAHRRGAAAEASPEGLRSRGARSSQPLRAEQVAQSVADQVDAEHQHRERDARDHDHPGARRTCSPCPRRSSGPTRAAAAARRGRGTRARLRAGWRAPFRASPPRRDGSRCSAGSP